MRTLIDNRRCKYIRTIAECHSISKAAQKLYVSQPSLSRLVKKVEEELGVSLFDRDTTPLGLTAAGEKYLDYIERFQQLDKEMQLEFAAMGAGMTSQLVIATLSLLGIYVLPKIVPNFAEHYPSVDLEIQEDTSLNVLQRVECGTADLAITNLKPDSEQLQYHLLCKDPIILAAPYNDRMRQRFPDWNGDLNHPIPADLPLLEAETLIVLRPWQNMRVAAEAVCRHYSFAPQRVIEAPSLASALSLAGSGRGITFICPSYVRCLAPSTPLIYFSLGEMEDITNILAVSRRDTANPLVSKFCACAARSLLSSVPSP